MIFWLAELQSATDLDGTRSLLTREEALFFARLSGELRRGEWLLGRSLAKQLVQRYCEVTKQPVPDRRAIGILPSASGAPMVYLDGTPQPIALSISHSHGAGFCALTPAPGLRIGADIERITTRDESFLLDFFTDGERQTVSASAMETRTTIATAIWSAREAYYKAVGTGLPLRQGAVEVVAERIPGAEWTPFALRNTDEGEYEGSWRVWNGYVLAVVTG